jgi:hypothetical protein
MATSLATLRQELSKYLGDYHAGTTTGAGAAGGTTLVDSALTEWLADEVATGAGSQRPSYALITDATLTKEERRIASLTIASGTITVTRAFTAQITSGKTYEIHKAFSATEKERAIARAVKDCFPFLYVPVDSTSLRYGDWLIDGSFEDWSTSSALTNWSKAGTMTLARTSTSGKVKDGTYSCALSGATDYLYQGSAKNADLLELGGLTPIFRCWGWASTANQLCLALYDGTTTTYGNHESHGSTSKVYHPGDSTWRLMEVTATMATNPTDVQARVYYDATDSTAYIDDGSITGVGSKHSYDLSFLGMVNDQPRQIHRVLGRGVDDDSPMPRQKSIPLNKEMYDLETGRLIFRWGMGDGTKLRIRGMKYLTEPTATTDTEVEDPQTDIIVSAATIRLYEMLRHETPYAEVDRVNSQLSYEKYRFDELCRKHGMPDIPFRLR